jgi:hypothetical protein
LLTGQSIKNVPSSGSGDFVLIAIGGLIIVGLGVYYVSLSKRPKPFKPAVVLQTRNVQVHAAPAKRIISAPSILSAPMIPPTPPDVERLLARATALIDEKEYDQALLLYKEALGALKGDTGLQQILHEQISTLYSKLLLFRHLADAKQAADAADAAALSSALHEVHVAAAAVGDQPTQLVREAKASYADYVKRLNMLEAERAGRY